MTATAAQSINLNQLDKTDWQPFRFDQIAKSVSERVDPNNTDIEVYIGLEHLDSESLHIKRMGTPADVNGQKLKCYPGDVIFGKRRAYQRKAAIVNTEAICSAHAMVLRANPEVIDSKLFPFFLHSDQFMHRAIDISVGSLSPTINWKTLREQEFLLPPKSQQAEIAELLWAMDDVVQARITNHQKSVSSNNNILENLILRYEQGAPRTTLGGIGAWTSGGTPSKKNANYWENGDLMWVTPKDMKSSLITETQDKVTQEAVSSGKSKLFKSGSTVLVWRSGILQHTFPIAKVDREFTVNQDLKVFVSKTKDFLPDYVHVYLLINAEKIRRKCVKEGTTVQSINSDSFLNFPIAKILKDRQSEINDLSSLFNKTVRAAQESLIAAQTLQKSLINQVF